MSPKFLSRRKVLKTGLGVGLGASASVFSIGSYAQSKPIPITIANAAGNVNLIMQELMKQQGFLEKMGLAPTIMNVADGAKMMGGIINGEIDCTTMSGFGQIFPAIEKGAKLKVLAGAALTRGADLPRLFDSLAIGNMLGAVWIAWCLRRARQPDQAPGANPP